MKQKMKVFLYKVVPHDSAHELDALLNLMGKHKLHNRVKPVGSSDVRIEDITVNSGNFYFDIVKFRDQHGPGKGSHKTPVVGFDFDKGESFCEETACLYIPKKRSLIMQYNHHGIRSASLQHYINSYTKNPDFTFELHPRYDDDTMRRFKNKSATKNIEFTVNTRFMNASDRKANVGLGAALDLGNNLDGEKVHVKISAGLGRKDFLTKAAGRIAEFLKDKSVDDADAVPKLKVGIKENLEGKTEVLDLIGHRLRYEFDDIPVGLDIRLSRNDRYAALDRAHSGWKALL